MEALVKEKPHQLSRNSRVFFVHMYLTGSPIGNNLQLGDLQ